MSTTKTNAEPRIAETISQSITNKVRKAGRQMQEKALANWRSWVEKVANGGTLPSSDELLGAAAVLGIADAANTFEADVSALAEMAVWRNGFAKSAEALEELLKPYGGNRDKLLAEFERAKDEVARLKDLLYDVDNSCGRGYWVSEAARLRRNNPRLFDPGAELFPEPATVAAAGGQGARKNAQGEG